MAAVDKLTERLRATAYAAAEAQKNILAKAANKALQAKIFYSIRETKQRIEENYAAIGEMVYESRGRSCSREKAEKLFARIDSLNDELAMMIDELHTRCGVCICEKCSSIITDGNVCGKCGARIQNE